jgi:Predicted nucleotide-binding protein containing TIR-like domain
MVHLKTTPYIFIGSSSEGKQIAEYLQLALEDYGFETVIWSQGVFGLAQNTLDTLLKVSKTYNYAILILTPDDIVTKRGNTRPVARDNVLFELGLFMGSIGRDRIFIVHSRDDNIDMPTDLAGVTVARFNKPERGNWQAALAPVALRIRDAIAEIQADIDLVPLAALANTFEEEDQKNIIRPVLEALRDALDWSRTFSDKGMFETVQNQLLGDIKRIGKRRLTFRPPKLWDQWARLIQSLDEQTDEILLVSNNDLRYWIDAITEEGSEARNYSYVLRQFKGHKTRILVVDRSTLLDPEQDEDAVRVIKSMISDGFRVVVVIEQDVLHPPDPWPRIWTDFGIIGSLAVSFFDQDEDDDISRSLIESFDDYDKRKAKKDWETLLSLSKWDSGDPDDGSAMGFSKLKPRDPDGGSDMGFREWLLNYRAKISSKSRPRSPRK